MTTNHIDQLAQWYADAEQVTKTNLPRKGDTLIYPRRTSGYIIEADGGGWAPEFVHSAGETVRILARAPEPKPAWHDAVAVIAETGDDDTRRAFVPQYNAETGDERLGTWADWQDGYDASELIDPVPLIEAKVTDEMVERYRDEEMKWRLEGATSHPSVARLLLTAALGLETA